jgi:ribosomal protein L44E
VETLAMGRAAQVDSIKTRVKSGYGGFSQRLKVGYHKVVSTVAINLKLRRYKQRMARS